MCVVVNIRYFILFSREGEVGGGGEVVQFLPCIFYFLFFSQQIPLQEFFFLISMLIFTSVLFITAQAL